MSSAYGQIARPGGGADGQRDPLKDLLPSSQTLENGAKVTVLQVSRDSSAIVLDAVHEMLNSAIRDGNSYPQEEELDRDRFLAYFLSHDAFVVVEGGAESQEVMGAFYIKPNYPGRCSHVCNGGFLTRNTHRRKGVATLMGQLFIQFAPKLGYRSSVFNLVFENNQASVGTWRKLGFREIGRVPGAGRLTKQGGGEEYVDAIMFYYDFTAPSEDEEEESDDR